jgi:F420-0:gamma-glutamyl ligase-like protein
MYSTLGKIMTDLQKDVLNGLAFITGVIGFFSGEFIISSVIFAGTAIASNINVNRKLSRKNRANQNQVKRRM